MSNKNYKKEALQYEFGFVWTGAGSHPRGRAWEELKVRAMKTFFDSEGLEDFPGVKIVARWRNPDNRNPRHANWKTTEDFGQDIRDFYVTLHGARGALEKARAVTDEKFKAIQFREAVSVSRRGAVHRRRKTA